jgi:hypothetical protein
VHDELESFLDWIELMILRLAVVGAWIAKQTLFVMRKFGEGFVDAHRPMVDFDFYSWRYNESFRQTGSHETDRGMHWLRCNRRQNAPSGSWVKTSLESDQS